MFLFLFFISWSSCQMWDPYDSIDIGKSLVLSASDETALFANGNDSKIYTVNFGEGEEVSPSSEVSLIITNGTLKSLDPDATSSNTDSVLKLSPPYQTISFLVQSSTIPDSSVILVASLDGFSTIDTLKFLPSRPTSIFFPVSSQTQGLEDDFNLELSLVKEGAGKVSDQLLVEVSAVQVNPGNARISFPSKVLTQEEKATIPISNLDSLPKEITFLATIKNELGEVDSAQTVVRFE